VLTRPNQLLKRESNDHHRRGNDPLHVDPLTPSPLAFGLFSVLDFQIPTNVEGQLYSSGSRLPSVS